MLLSTTENIGGLEVIGHLGIVSSEIIMGINFVKDIFAGVSDTFGGRSGAYEKEMRKAKDIAFKDIAAQAESMGANAIVGVSFDYELLTGKKSMLLLSVAGTAVRVERGD